MVPTPEERATAAHVLKDAGHSAEAIAELLHVSTSQAYRYLSEFPHPESEPDNPSTVDGLADLLGDQELDAEGRLRAALAYQLARKLDKAAASDKAQDAIAVPALVKELRAVIAEILDVSADDKAWLADIFKASEG